MEPRHRWVFDKLQVALSQGLAAGPHGTMPPEFPVFSKPIMNFRGLGAGSRILASAEDYDQHHTRRAFLDDPAGRPPRLQRRGR